ncbi:hypothetical protein TNCT_625831 [Trichonephila clavata]|uniref:Uncharacterized protein n=1 Tax=Trichonephila clavata TaxID=2740835 RepID=A0A8X6FGV4_TRICU|nr:hypothetical protein TNCT_625831 [Trichonephila clavata]
MDALKLTLALLRTAFKKVVNHLLEIAENEQLHKNALEINFKQLKLKSVKLKEVGDSILDIMSQSNCSQEAYNKEFEAIEGYAEKMIS